jgi:hypothetical protein
VLVNAPRTLPPAMTTVAPKPVVRVEVEAVIATVVSVSVLEPTEVTATVPTHVLRLATVIEAPLCSANVVVVEPDDGPRMVLALTEPAPLSTVQPSNTRVPVPPLPNAALPNTVTPLDTVTVPVAVSAPPKVIEVEGPSVSELPDDTEAVSEREAMARDLMVPRSEPEAMTTRAEPPPLTMSCEVLAVIAADVSTERVAVPDTDRVPDHVIEFTV